MRDIYDLIKIQNAAAETAKREIIACNAFTEQRGLSLSESEAAELVQLRDEALKASGRIELSGGIMPRLIYAFFDSPYIDSENYQNTLADLQEAFYMCKSEARDMYTDDEIIEFMVTVFNGAAHGSAEYLIGTSIEELCRRAGNGGKIYGYEEEEAFE